MVSFLGLLCFVSFGAFANPNERLEIVMKDGSSYSIALFTADTDSARVFSELSPEVRDQFLKNRELILRAIAGTLHGLRIPIGVWRKMIRPQLDWLYGKSKPLEEVSLNFQETGFVSVQAALQELDKHLWEKSETISQTNEYGIALEMGVSGGGKAGARGFYGIMGFGLLLTVDPLERAVAFELFGDLEKTQRATPFYGGAGIFITMMGSALSTDWKKELCAEQGNAFCAAGLVGFLSDRYVGLGLSKELGIGFPGTVLMESELSRMPLLRLGVSDQWPGFIRVQTAGVPNLLRIFSQVKERVKQSCSDLLSRIQSEKRL